MTRDQRGAESRLSPRAIVILSLLPGAMAVSFAWLAAPLASRLAAPPLMIKLLGNALFLGMFEMAFLVWWSRKQSPGFSLRQMTPYRESMPWWRYAVFVIALLAWGFAVSGLLGPVGAALRDQTFAWMPSVFTMDPVSLAPSLYSRGSVVITVLLGILSTGVAIPIVEELYYRGFLMSRMSWMGWLAPLVNVVLWSLNHLFEPWNIPLFLLTFMPVAYVVRWKKNLYVAIIAHVLANLMAVLPMLTWLAN